MQRSVRLALMVSMSVVCLVVVEYGHAQGSLTPSGAPSATMKTLDQLDTAITAVQNSVDQVDTKVVRSEPRTAIVTVPYVISNSGSYYLTRSLTTTSDVPTIIILSDDVTLDLMGFCLRCTAPGASSLTGIVNTANSNVEVRNGTVRGFGTGVFFGGGKGNKIVSVRAIENASRGLQVSSANSAVVDCMAIGPGNSTNGISVGVGSIVARCVVSSCTGSGIIGADGCSIVGNTVMSNGIYGISAGARSTIADNVVSGSGHSDSGISSGDHCIMARNTVADASGYGLKAGYGCTVIGNTCSTNTGTGIFARYGSVVAENVAGYNGGNGVNPQGGCSVWRNSTIHNGGSGIYAGDFSSIVGNSSYNNESYGIYAGSICSVAQNACYNNGATGLRVHESAVVKDNALNGNNTQESSAYAGIRASAYCLIKDNVATDNHVYNIYLYRECNSIENNLVGDGGYGLYFNNAGSPVATNNVYGNNRLMRNTTNVYNSVMQTNIGGNVEF